MRQILSVGVHSMVLSGSSPAARSVVMAGGGGIIAAIYIDSHSAMVMTSGPFDVVVAAGAAGQPCHDRHRVAVDDE
ncbi:hypothetical protein [Rhodococcus sp. O3]|uniref:hypothetical protein n=1 Tax=Rhodococcus sp. O3 TaxID=3404919 RepID=UPI003B682830